MTDLTDLTTVSGDALSEDQIRGILAQIDLDIMNLLRDGKLAALKYGIAGEGGRSTDRASNLHALVETRRHYENLLLSLPGWEVSQYLEE